MILRGLVCVVMIFAISGCMFMAKTAKVAVASGQSYDVASARLAKGSALNVACGEALMRVPFGKISAMKIDPGRVTSVEGRPYLGVEIRMMDGTVIGDIGGQDECFVCADNSLTGKSSKARYSAPFSSLSGIEILGKGETGKARLDSDEDEEGDEDE